MEVPEWLHQLRGALLVQCWPSEVQQVAELADRQGTGLVVTTSDAQVARAVAEIGKGRVLLFDASRYVGAGRLAASASFRDPWLRLQRSLGLPVLTDSGYAGPEDRTGVVSVLDRAAPLGTDVVATLALSPWWLDSSGGLEFLIEQVSRVGVPVAIALEHRSDPLGVRKTLHGLIRLLSVGVPVIQLRCDVSGLGLLCHGAWAAAVGTQSNLRHFYPVPPTRHRFRPPKPKIATVVKELLSYIAVDRIAQAVQSDPDDSLWLPCECVACNYRTLNWISTLTDEEDKERAAFTHALEMLFGLRDELMTGSLPEADRQAGWRAQCSNAMFRFQAVDNGGVDGWSPPPFLRYWHGLPLAPKNKNMQ